MDDRFLERKVALLEEAQVDATLFEGCCKRLDKFLQPFVARLVRREQERHAADFVAGLISDVERKNAESIAYRHQQERNEMQHFLGESKWDHRPLLMELARQVGRDLGRPDGVIVFDPSSFPKKGRESVGVQRQWCGRLGKLENCQVGVYLGYVSVEEHALVNMRLYLPREWAKDRKRRLKCHVPREVKFQTRHRLCLNMLDEVGSLLPHGWIAGDEELGRSSGFRRDLRACKERYLLCVPSNTLIRDLESPLPAHDGPGVLRKAPFVRADKWRAQLTESAWTLIDVRDGEKGPLMVEITTCRVAAKTDTKRVGPEELLVIVRTRDEQDAIKYDYYLSNAAPDTPRPELARVAKAEHRIEECLQRGKSEIGLGDYEVRGWGGWHHHQTLSLIAAWFLNVETRAGKKNSSGAYFPPATANHRQVVSRGSWHRSTARRRLRMCPPSGTQPTCEIPSLQTT